MRGRIAIGVIAVTMTLVIAGYVFIGLRSLQTDTTIDRNSKAEAIALQSRAAMSSAAFRGASTPAQRLSRFTQHLQSVLDSNRQPVDRFVQIQLRDPSTNPAAFPLLRESAGHRPVLVPAPILGEVTKSGNSSSTDVREKDEALHVYLTPLAVPLTLQPDGVIGVVEVFQVVRH